MVRRLTCINLQVGQRLGERVAARHVGAVRLLRVAIHERPPVERVAKAAHLVLELELRVAGRVDDVAGAPDAGVTGRLGQAHPEAVVGIHLLDVDSRHGEADGELDEDERAYLDGLAAWREAEGAYGHQHSTRPLTLAQGLSDSPSGLLAWILEHAPGPRIALSIEGTRSYGIGLARAATTAGLLVLECEQPHRKTRRGKGKSDPIDAHLAVLTALRLDADRLPTPRADGDREALRILLSARQELTTASTAQTNRLRALLLGGDDVKSIFESAAKRTDILQYMLVLAGDLVDGA